MSADLDRFLAAQAPVWADVAAELARGRKASHWMWFVFPQLRGLGRSATAERFAIDDLAEARAYAAHPVLGARLREACRLLLAIPPRPIRDVMGTPDDLKLRSSMTLFAAADPAEPLFAEVLRRYFDGAPDPLTLSLLAGGGPEPWTGGSV